MYEYSIFQVYKITEIENITTSTLKKINDSYKTKILK